MKYRDFRIVLMSDGYSSEFDLREDTLTGAKRFAIERVRDALDKRYGRGNHVATVFGMTWQDTATQTERRAGFQQFSWVVGQKLFVF